MQQSSDTFWDAYRVLVGRLLRPLKASDGCSEQRVQEAELRLGRPLPRLLRELYLLTGTRGDIHTVDERLLPLESLLIRNEVLVFYEENQGVCLWGVDVHDPDVEDPPVLCEDDTDSPIWEPHFDHLSQFMVAMLFLQAANGGMRHCGNGTALGANIAQATSDWEAIEIGGAWNNRVLMRDGVVLYIADEEPNPYVCAGARTKRKFWALERAFGVSWNYCNLDGE